MQTDIQPRIETLPEKKLLDNRPHFAVMGKKHKNDDPNSKEELYIAIVAEKQAIEL